MGSILTYFKSILRVVCNCLLVSTYVILFASSALKDMLEIGHNYKQFVQSNFNGNFNDNNKDPWPLLRSGGCAV